MLSNLKKLNPEIPVFDVSDGEFSAYGRVVTDIDVTEIISEAKKLEMPSDGSLYNASVESFERTSFAAEVRESLFGELPSQCGYCWGYNSFMDALEWHNSGEINVSVTPLVLILGTRSDIRDGTPDSSKLKAFFVPEGVCLEVYATTLHYCPCQVRDDGFGFVVVLPKGTNTPLEHTHEDKLLFCKNKWLIAHNDNAALISEGAQPGIAGINFEIKYK